MSFLSKNYRFHCFVSLGLLVVSQVVSSGSTLAQSTSQSTKIASDNWARFHGPNGTGLTDQTELPTDISDSNYRWKIELAGSGTSSPVIWDDSLFITSSDPQTAQLTLQCFSAKTGQTKWKKSFESTAYRIHRLNDFAASTPAVDEQHVYLTYASPDRTMLVAMNHKGKIEWERDFGAWRSQHGFAISPMVYQDKVILVNSQLANPPDGAPGGSRAIAVSCVDGSDVWESPLTATRTCYALPAVHVGSDGKEQLISCNTGDGFFSLNPKTGKQNWKTNKSPFRMRVVASTLIVDDLVIGSNGSGGGGNYLVAMQLDDQPGKPPRDRFQIQKANYVPSPIAVDGKLFVFSDKGIAQCIDLKTGDRFWQQRLSKGFSGSPVSDSKSIYLMDNDGNLFVVAVSSEYQLRSKHFLGEPSSSTPAISDGRLYLRTNTHLICLE